MGSGGGEKRELFVSVEEVVKIHQLAYLFPEMQPGEFAELKADIKANGLLEPIITYQDEIIDGRHRFKACEELGIEPRFEAYEGDSPASFVVSKNLMRRQLTSSQKAAVAVDMLPFFEEEARKRMQAGVELDPTQKIAEGESRQQVADVLGTNRQYVSDAKKLKEENPEIFEDVKTGKINLHQANKEVKKTKVKQAEQQIDQTQSNQTDIYTTDKKYQIIYADPAWEYWSGGQKNQSLHYKTMTIDDIKALPVSRIADDNCVLFLWVTYPILRESFDVIEAWGFTYSTAGFVWVKKNKNEDTNFFGLGSWTRANSELCLIAKKGFVTRIDASISQVIEHPIGEHSVKPPQTRDLITQLVGKLPRIELFSRQEIDGWDYWGDGINV